MIPCCNKCHIYLDYKDSHQCSDSDCPCHSTEKKGMEFSGATFEQRHDHAEKQDGWEEKRDWFITNVGRIFQKHFGKTAVPCPDCGGSMYHVCEKNLREMYAQAMDKTHEYDMTLLQATRQATLEEVEGAQEERLGWNGFALVDPDTMYCNDQFFLHKATAIACKKSMQKSGWGKLKIIEVEIYPKATLKNQHHD